MEAVKSAGFDVKIVKLVHGLRKMGKSGRQEQDYLVEAYRRAIGIGESQESAEYTAENAQREADESAKVNAAVVSVSSDKPDDQDDDRLLADVVEVKGDGPIARAIRGDDGALQEPPADGKDGDEWVNPRTATVYKMIGGAWLPKPVENKVKSRRISTMEDGTKYHKDTGEIVESRPIASVEDGAI